MSNKPSKQLSKTWKHRMDCIKKCGFDRAVIVSTLSSHPKLLQTTDAKTDFPVVYKTSDGHIINEMDQFNDAYDKDTPTIWNGKKHVVYIFGCKYQIIRCITLKSKFKSKSKSKEANPGTTSIPINQLYTATLLSLPGGHYNGNKYNRTYLPVPNKEKIGTFCVIIKFNSGYFIGTAKKKDRTHFVLYFEDYRRRHVFNWAAWRENKLPGFDTVSGPVIPAEKQIWQMVAKSSLNNEKWVLIRLLWIAHKKNEKNVKCLLAQMPKDIIVHIISLLNVV